MKKPRYATVMKTVRRVHMYLGLAMYPWVLLYGLSGMLFNHPGVGRDIQPERLAPERLAELTGFTPWDPEEIRQAIVGQLNARGDHEYRAVGSAKLVGFPIFVSPASDGGRDMMIMSLTAGRAGVAHHPPPGEHAPAPFAGPIDTPEYTMAAIAARLGPVSEAFGLSGPPLAPHPKVAPRLQFGMDDGTRSWNAVYNLRTGELTARPADGPSHVSFVELLEKLHTQHHFPVHWGVSGYWAIFTDLTGLCLMIWALSGLFMWWQIRPSRRAGAIAIGVSLLVAGLVMTGMASELSFLTEPASGP